MSISVPDGTPEELIATSEAVAGYITAAGGRVLRSSNESPWGRRRLAYPIRHNSTDLRDGFYTLYHFELDPDRIEDVEREIRLNERIIRHLLLLLESEPIFVEEEEEITAETDPETGETIVTDETVVVAEAPASGEAVVVDEVEVVVEDAEGNVEAAAEDVEVVTAEEE
jgi:small subunit ribosomal protein S6